LKSRCSLVGQIFTEEPETSEADRLAARIREHLECHPESYLFDTFAMVVMDRGEQWLVALGREVREETEVRS